MVEIPNAEKPLNSSFIIIFEALRKHHTPEMLFIEKHKYLCGDTQVKISHFLVHCVGYDMPETQCMLCSFHFSNDFIIRLMGA